VGCLVEDLRAGALAQPPDARRADVDALLAERAPNLVTVDGWRAIDALEREHGRRLGRPRLKLTARDELLGAAGAAGEAS
jgi:ferredoxin/flavodoxin---NADP+ reductase